MSSSITVTIPATAANLGPGFDCLGLALTLFNRVVMSEISSGIEIEVGGEGSDRIPTDATNLVVKAAERLFRHVGRRPSGLRIHQVNEIPVGSGLGSSAAAVVGGVIGAAALLGEDLSRAALLEIAGELEGHPDNVAPALYGGLTLVLQTERGWLVESMPVHPFKAVVVLPEYRLPTVDARAALPSSLPLADAVFNIGRMGLLLPALARGDVDQLRVAMEDRLHQPHRLKLVPGLEGAFTAGRKLGAAVALSGAGPALIAFCAGNHEIVSSAMAGAFETAGIPSRSWLLPVSQAGCQLVER